MKPIFLLLLILCIGCSGDDIIIDAPAVHIEYIKHENDTIIVMFDGIPRNMDVKIHNHGLENVGFPYPAGITSQKRLILICSPETAYFTLHWRTGDLIRIGCPK